MVLNKTLESPLDCKEIQPVHSEEEQPWESLEGMMLMLKLHYFGHLMQELTHWKRLWCWEGLGAGEGDDRGWDGWMASWTRWTWVWVNSGDGDGQGGLACCDSWGREESDTTERLNWTELNWTLNKWIKGRKLNGERLKWIVWKVRPHMHVPQL